jgi:hypothetical protein
MRQTRPTELSYASLERLRYAAPAFAALQRRFASPEFAWLRANLRSVIVVGHQVAQHASSKEAASVTLSRWMKPYRRQIAILVLYPKLGLAMSISGLPARSGRPSANFNVQRALAP